MENSQTKNIIELAKATFNKEWNAIKNLEESIDENVAIAIDIIHHTIGRVIITGIGKSAIIAQKIVATMNSTGTPALFMHAADAVHGDLGMIQSDDCVIIISKSGNTSEIKLIIPLIKNFKNKIIAICGNYESYLAQQADVFLNTFVSEEACPNNLAPTTSTTAQLVMGDALAIILLHLKGFNQEDFARFHPGGALGKQLYMRVKDLITKNQIPSVAHNAPLKEIIVEISGKRLGATIVENNNGTMIGIITDGDLRRMLEQNNHYNDLTAENLMTKNPKSIHPNAMAVDALSIMRNHNITQLPVIDDNICVGIVHLHDLIREGIV